jgi:class 3 adenylate cyclase
MTSSSRRNNNNNGTAMNGSNGDISLDYGGMNESSKRANNGSSSQLPARTGRRRSSLGLEEGTMGGGVPNPYGYSTPSQDNRPSRAAARQQQRAAAAVAASNNNNTTLSSSLGNGNGRDLSNLPLNAAPPPGPKGRRDTGIPGRGANNNTHANNANTSNLPPGGRGIAGRGRGGVVGVVRQGSARIQLKGPASTGRGGPGRGPAPGRGPGGPNNNNQHNSHQGSKQSSQQQTSSMKGVRDKIQHQHKESHPQQPHPQQTKDQQRQLQKQRIQETTQLTSKNSLLSQDTLMYSQLNNGAGGRAAYGEKSYGSLFYEEEDEDETISHGDSPSEDSIPLMNVMNETTQVRQVTVDAKKDALVESLVWFSHHTPRTVLEDLVSHEIEIWQAERGVDMTIVEEESEESFEESNLTNSVPFSSSLAGSSQLGSPFQRKSAKKYNTLGSINDSTASYLGESQNESAVSDLSDEGMEFYDGNFSESILKLQQGQSNADVMIKLPKMVEREGAVVFADISGFTKLSTMLDCESLSKVINSYFDMIVHEVVSHGGDILKFAGDAFFAEWKLNDYDDGLSKTGGVSNPLSNLNASLSTIQDMSGFNNGRDEDVPRVATCVLAAAKCAAAIVEKFSDFSVGQAMPHAMPMIDGVRQEAILNVHCGLGAGKFVGLHVGDYKEDPDEEGVELRREFLVMGDPIDQAALAADAATDGEVLASPKALAALAFCCDDMPQSFRVATSPTCIAARGKTFFSLEGNRERSEEIDSALNNEMLRYEALRTHCRDLNQSALARLHLQMALYVHPVIRDDELALSAQIRQGKIAQPQATIEDRHLAEAELRSVFTIFIKTILTPKITWDPEIDGKLYTKLGDIMHVVSRELDRYSGHLRQFIVDDKGTTKERFSCFNSDVA